MFARKKDITKILIEHSKAIELYDQRLIRKSQTSKLLDQGLVKSAVKKPFKKLVKSAVKKPLKKLINQFK